MSLTQDREKLSALLAETLAAAEAFLTGLDERPVAAIPNPSAPSPPILAEEGVGASQALAHLRARYEAGLSGSAGPRYFGFVTGGVTPAALMGDWLTGVYDQNALGSEESIAAQLELDTLALLRQLFGLSTTMQGSFVTGATMANFVGLALGRQWAGEQMGVAVDQVGLAGLPPIPVLSGAPHSSIYKALSMLGMGRACLEQIPHLPDREAVDGSALAHRLAALDGRPAIVVANAGTVNTVDFDDLRAIIQLREKFPFWLHVDGAFGGFAACAPEFAHLTAGLDQADSLTIDAHKWLNVPYDSAMQFTRHPALQAQVFQNAAAYLGQEISPANFVHLTPENSRRLRALPAWMSLMAYGRQGYANIVATCCAHACWLGQQIDRHPHFRLLAPVRLNGVCFTLTTVSGPEDAHQVRAYLHRIEENGDLFLTPTVYAGLPAMRISVTNWRTRQADVERAWAAMQIKEE